MKRDRRRAPFRHHQFEPPVFYRIADHEIRLHGEPEPGKQRRCESVGIVGPERAVQPDFVVGEAIAEGRLEVVMPDWTPPPIALHLVMPPGGPRPARVEVLAAFLTERLAA